MLDLRAGGYPPVHSASGDVVVNQQSQGNDLMKEASPGMCVPYIGCVW